MKPECRAELRKIRGAATQGSWVGGPMGVLSGATWVVENTLDDSGDIMGSEDTECIVAAVNALVPLLDALDAAEADKVLAAGELLWRFRSQERKALGYSLPTPRCAENATPWPSAWRSWRVC